MSPIIYLGFFYHPLLTDYIYYKPQPRQSVSGNIRMLPLTGIPVTYRSHGII
jgi:hypothetical protein